MLFILTPSDALRMMSTICNTSPTEATNAM
jgi:hypothetical protein